MTLDELKAMTNEGGKKFARWLSNMKIVGTTERGMRKGEFLVVFIDRDGRYRTAILSKADERNDGSCFYGSINHYCTELQRAAAVARGERYPGRYCPKTAKEITEWIMKEFGVPREVFWYK